MSCIEQIIKPVSLLWDSINSCLLYVNHCKIIYARFQLDICASTSQIFSNELDCLKHQEWEGWQQTQENKLSHISIACVVVFFFFFFFFFSKNRLGWFGKLTSESTKVDNVLSFLENPKKIQNRFYLYDIIIPEWEYTWSLFLSMQNPKWSWKAIHKNIAQWGLSPTLAPPYWAAKGNSLALHGALGQRN